MKNQKLIITVLIVLLVIAVIYIAVLKIQSYNEKQAKEAYQQGVQFGYEMSVKQLLNEMSGCKPVPVYADNLTVNVIAVECLQQQAPIPNLPTPEELEEQMREEQTEQAAE
jgi:Tfp pilus assembly protein PilV